MELKGTIVTYSGFTPSNKNHVTVEVTGMENYFGNVIKTGDEVVLKHGATEDKKAPVQEYETAESVLLRRGVHYTIPNEIKTVTVKSALQAMKEFASQERNRAIQECIDKVCEWVEFAKGEFLKDELSKLKK